MLLPDIYEKSKWLLTINFDIEDRINIYNANFTDDLKLDRWDINLLLNMVENKFDIKLNYEDERNILNLNDLAICVYNTKTKSKVA